MRNIYAMEKAEKVTIARRRYKMATKARGVMGAGQNGNGIKSIAHDRIRNSSENAKGSNRHFNGQIQSLRIGTLNPITILQHIYNRLSTLHGHCALHKERAGNKIDQLQCIQIRRTRQMILTHETQAMI